MNTYRTVSRVLVVAMVVVISNVMANDNFESAKAFVTGIATSPAAKVATGAILYLVLENGKLVIKEAREGNEDVQNVLTAATVGGSVAQYTGSIPLGAVAAGTVVIGGKIISKTKDTSVGKSTKKTLGDTLTSTPVRIGLLSGAGIATACAAKMYFGL